MKKNKLLLVAMLVAHSHNAHVYALCQQPSKQHYHIDSPFLERFDGTSVGINGEIIELIKVVSSKITTLLQGKKIKGIIVDKPYLFEGEKYAVQDFVEIEDAVQADSTHPERLCELQQILGTAKTQLIAEVADFMESARNTKQVLLHLIEKSCTLRGMPLDPNNPDSSLLLQWGKANTAEEERSLFDEKIGSFANYNRFGCQLLDFLGDLVKTSPKGYEQFKARMKKYESIRNVLPQLTKIRQSSAPEPLKHAFFLYVKTHYLDKLSVQDITPSKLEQLFQEFETNQ